MPRRSRKRSPRGAAESPGEDANSPELVAGAGARADDAAGVPGAARWPGAAVSSTAAAPARARAGNGGRGARRRPGEIAPELFGGLVG